MAFRGMGGYRGDFMMDDPSSDPADPGYDFSDVIGGTSTVGEDPGSVMMAGFDPLALLGSAGAAITRYMPSGAGALAMGSAAAAGASALSSPSVRRKVRKWIGGAMGGPPRRHMNPGNFKALRRSMRRLSSFEKAAKRVYKFTHPVRGHSKFKFPRRKKR